MKKLSRHPLSQKVLIGLAAVYARLVFATSRVTVVQSLPAELANTPIVFALWHQQIVFAPVLMRKTQRPLLALMSGSRDGRAISQIAAMFGIEASVGSSHRGALAGTRGLLRAAQNGKNILMTPDGPRGPARVPKQGASEISRLTGLPLVPCGAWSTRGICVNSWDACRIPFPFSRITLVLGAPLEDATQHSLQQALNTLTAQAQAAAGHIADNGATN